VAQFSAELGQYGEAISIYEDVAKRCVDNNLLKYSAKGYLLNAGICHLCGELPPPKGHVSMQRVSVSLSGMTISEKCHFCMTEGHITLQGGMASHSTHTS